MKELSIQTLYQILETFCNFVIIDADGVITYMNKSYLDILGISQEDAIGKHVTKIIPNTKLNETIKTGVEEDGVLFTLYDHAKKMDTTLVCNRIPIFEDGHIVGAMAITTLNNLNGIDILHKEIERIKNDNKIYQKQLAVLQQNIFPLDKIIGVSESVKEIKNNLEDYAKSNLPILITGETGVGKEIVANAIHQLSNRNLNSYVKINCAAIPKDLLESELFGYVEGAFSGAAKGGKIGKFELADNGTILLDEIGELPIELQAKLLRILQEKELEKIGSVKTTKLNIRLICSTNQNLEALVEKRLFREDLYYRINVIEINVPSLRERKDDIEPLCDFFISKVSKENGYNIQGINQEVIEYFKKYNWPGNIRELEHVIERAALACKRGTIELAHCGFIISKIVKTYNSSDTGDTLKGKRDLVERQSIIDALQKAGGNKSKAAKLLSIDRSILYDKIKRYNIDSNQE